MLIWKEILLLASLSFAAANPVKDATRLDAKERLVEGERVTVKRGAVISSKYKWPTSTEGGETVVLIPFVADSDLDSKAESELKRAIQDLNVATCVRFQPWSGQSDYVSFEDGQGCVSKIGKRVGKQVIYLGTGCEFKGTILHELIHLLGFYHEHNRADRDSYIRIFEENILEGEKKEMMKKYQPGDMDNLGFPYDLKSIMQYEKTAFAKKQGLVTMEAISDPNMELGNQNAMSAADIMKINKLYHCPGNGDLYKNMQVTVQTGDGWWDGTNAFLYLELISEGGKRSGESSVAKGGYYDDFESDKKDHYLVAFKDVGPIRQLKVRLQENPHGTYFDGWSFAQITIKDGRQTYKFGGRDLSPGDSVTVNAS